MNPSYIKFALKKIVSSMEHNPDPFVEKPGVDFSRNRIFTLSKLTYCTLSMENHSINKELRRFFSYDTDRLPTKSAFIMQRKKLKGNAFPHILDSLNNLFPFRKKYHGFHLLACDGSDLNLPPLPGDAKTFVPSNTAGVGSYQLHLNALYDILEKRYTDVEIQNRTEIDERKAFLEMVSRNRLPGKNLFIADCGYISVNVIARLLHMDQFFLIRAKDLAGERSFLKRFSLPDTNEFDHPIQFDVTRSNKKCYRKHPEKFFIQRKDRPFDLIPLGDTSSCFSISIRVVKIDLGDNSEYLITNLPVNKFGIKELKELYHLRWGIETSFRFLKYTVALNSLHSVLRKLIHQEIYARLILYNASLLMANCVNVRQTSKKYTLKVSVSDAIDICRNYLVSHLKNKTVKELLLRYRTEIRPDRSFQRKVRAKRFVPLTNRA